MNTPEIQITKSWRKSISMSFDKQGVLKIKAPKFMLSGQIDAFIQKNSAWIEKHYSKIVERKQNKKYYLFGEPHPNPLLKERERASDIQKCMQPLSPGGERIQEGGLIGEKEIKALEKYYKQEAKQYIVPRCNELAEKHGFSHQGIRITSATTRWGSCSSKKTLNFSYRLIMSPAESIDYVIIHELCHLRQMNHGPKFWAEVAAIMPSYKKYEKHLKNEGWKYTL